jgi:hypothetical protein
MSLLVGNVAEQFIIVTDGGPHPGERVVDETQYPWPLPGILKDAGGAYFKVSESQAPPQEEGSRLVRSALYRWLTNAEIEEASSAQAPH